MREGLESEKGRNGCMGPRGGEVEVWSDQRGRQYLCGVVGLDVPGKMMLSCSGILLLSGLVWLGVVSPY